MAGGELLLHWQSGDRKSTRLNSSHILISYAVFCLKKKNIDRKSTRLNSSNTLISYAVLCLKKVEIGHGAARGIGDGGRRRRIDDHFLYAILAVQFFNAAARPGALLSSPPAVSPD